MVATRTIAITMSATFVKVYVLFLGEEALVETMETVGLEEKLDAIPSLALGSKEINMLDNSIIIDYPWGSEENGYFEN